ncbi:hypothetical protein BJY01DRAFT_246914 [Aspergillus pseudoustus]|uniref:BZIP domain-containing protein n=1 Tax=Aspergillus pseudoustus TaxID=1810923 RepID=A0ABR4K4U5_9EURO
MPSSPSSPRMLRGRKHRLKHRQTHHSAKKRSSDRPDRERGNLENNNSHVDGAKEANRQFKSNLKQEDLDNFRGELDDYATLIANLSTLCKFLTSRAPTTILLETEEFSQASPRLLSFVRNRPLTAIIPQLVLPPPIESKGAGSCSGSIGRPTDWGSPDSEMRTVQRSQSAELWPQISDQSSAQCNTEQTPKVAAPEAWPAQLVETGSSSLSPELSGQVSRSEMNSLGMIPGEHHCLMTQTTVAHPALPIATQRTEPASTRSQQLPYTIGRNPTLTASTGPLQQTSVGSTSAAPQGSSGPLVSAAVAQFPNIGHVNHPILAAMHQPSQTTIANSLQMTSVQPAQARQQMSLLSQPHAGEVVGHGWRGWEYSQPAMPPAQSQVLSATQTGGGYPNVHQPVQQWHPHRNLRQPINAPLVLPTQTGSHTQLTPTRGLDSRPMVNRGVGLDTATGQSAADNATNQWLTSTHDMNIMLDHQENYLI